MRTTKGLMDANLYKSGKTAYKGSIYGRYASTYHQEVTIQPQISNGGNVILPVESELRSACEGLRKGEIGARKHSVRIEGKTTVISEAIAECYDLNAAKQAAASGKSAEEWLESELKYTDNNGNSLTLKDVREIRSGYQSQNKLIRDKIKALKLSHNWKPKDKMSDELLSDISQLMKGYSSLTGLDLVITVHDKHVINKTQDYVACSDEASYNKLLQDANYNDQGNRLVARNTPIKAIIPIQDIKQVETVKRVLQGKFSTVLLKMKGIEEVASDTHPISGVDLQAARSHDRQLSKDKR